MINDKDSQMDYIMEVDYNSDKNGCKTGDKYDHTIKEIKPEQKWDADVYISKGVGGNERNFMCDVSKVKDGVLVKNELLESIHLNDILQIKTEPHESMPAKDILQIKTEQQESIPTEDILQFKTEQQEGIPSEDILQIEGGNGHNKANITTDDKVVINQGLITSNRNGISLQNPSHRETNWTLNHLVKHTKKNVNHKPNTNNISGNSFITDFNINDVKKEYDEKNNNLFVNILERPIKDESGARNLTADVKIETKQDLVEDNDYPNEIVLFDNVCKENDMVLENSLSHPYKRKYQCNPYDGSLLENDEISIYMREYQEMNPYKCSFCDEAFSDNQYLKCHMKIHSRDKPFLCHKCDIFFFDNGSLIRHLRTHFKEKLYQCTQCNKEFSENSHIIGENEYLCNNCHNTNLKKIESKTTHLSNSYKKSRSSRDINKDNQIMNQDSTIKDICINLEDKMRKFGSFKLNNHKESNQALWYSHEAMKIYEEDKLIKKLEDCRILYISCIVEGTTKAELRKRFGVFGTIINMLLIFKYNGNNYCFIVFRKHSEAYNAMKHGNEDTSLPQYYLCLKNKWKYKEDDIFKKKWTGDHIIYIGCIKDGTYISDIKGRFNKFGDIRDIAMIFSGQTNNYCFITYSNPKETDKAIKNGNSDSSLPQYYICSKSRYDKDKLLIKRNYSDIFIGCISEDITMAEIRSRFSKFGTIINLSMNFSSRRTNYGYIKFTSCNEAYKAIKNGNKDTSYPHYYICSGGKKKYEGDCKEIHWGEDYKSIYISCVKDHTTITELRDRFKEFGTITNISLLSKQPRNNFSFITFKTQDEAYEAIKHGNDDISPPHYYISFKRQNKSLGHRRRDSYSESNEPVMNFDDLLKAAMKEKQLHN